MRRVLIKHRELLKFAIVGGTTFVIDNGIWFLLKFTVLESKPITAKAIAIIVATIVSYVLNREWSFRTRGGRETHHEAALFFLISGIAVVINLIPPCISRYVLRPGGPARHPPGAGVRRLRQRLDHRHAAGDVLPVLGFQALGVPGRPGQAPPRQHPEDPVIEELGHS